MKRRRALAPDRAALSVEIAGLAKADIKDLRERWKTLHGKASSGQIGRSFLIRAIAYRLQEQALGALKPATRRLLARIADETAATNSPKKPQSRKAGTGTILIREWQGNAHRVTVLDDGVAFDGKRYRSLSEVAREITGSRLLLVGTVLDDDHLHVAVVEGWRLHRRGSHRHRGRSRIEHAQRIPRAGPYRFYRHSLVAEPTP